MTGCLQLLVRGRDGSDSMLRGLWRNFGGQSLSDEARYQEMEQSHYWEGIPK